VLETRLDSQDANYPDRLPCLYSSGGTWFADCSDGLRLKILQLTVNGEPVAHNSVPAALANQPLALT
jgi:hypothetical protein